ncbi:hypothetical protein FRC09_016904 [Ceratobasidium sp. 395]|nr:hypothetical protein FRC09_016904 [Ceratobasidium sp. 395]
MSDDEYFDDDEIFNSAELDNIPSLNEPSDPHASVAPQAGPSRPTVVPAQPSGSQRPLQAPRRVPSSSSSNRLSTIMNALHRAAQPGTSSHQPLAPPKNSVLGSSNGLLGASNGKLADRPSRRKRDSPPSGSVSPGGSKSPQKRTRRSPTLETERRSSAGSSPNKAFLEEVSQSSKLEGKAEGRIEAWGVIEDESTCAICYEVYVAPQLTPCGHTACAPCLKQWLATNSSCPMCRTQVDRSRKPTDNLFCANIIDRLFNAHPEWHPGRPKRVEWNRRKQAWDQEVAATNARIRRSTRSTRSNHVSVPVAPQPRRQLFNPEPASDDDDDSSEDENFNEELLHEFALQNTSGIRVYY